MAATPSRSPQVNRNHHRHLARSFATRWHRVEKRTILNPARQDVSEKIRQRLGKAFEEERQRQLDDDCGSIDNVRRLVAEADNTD